ncbi:MAG: hypothetical protein RLZZ76_68 [Candidatus Parcubacteria bacterium]
MTAFQAVVGGSIPLTRTTNIKAVHQDGFYIVVVRSEASKSLCLREESKPLPALLEKERQRVLTM